MHRSVLARFAVVGSIVTLIDIGVFAVLLSPSLVRTDVVAVALATASSSVLHRAVTFRGDPYDRWLGREKERRYTALVGFFLDLLVVIVVSGGFRSKLARGALAKVVAIAVAAPVRWLLHRQVLVSIVRDQSRSRPLDRPPPPGAFRLSVVLPAYEEADRIGSTVATVRAALHSLED